MMEAAPFQRPKRRLYADFNNVAADGGLPMTCAGSKESIAALAPPLQDGEDVWLTDGEIGTRARVFWRQGQWEARSDWKFHPEDAGDP